MSDLKETLKLGWEELCWIGPSRGMIENTTADIEPQQEIIGQERAVKALKLGMLIKSKGYNAYVAGIHGTGRTATVKKLLDELNLGDSIPPDLCYVNNFRNPDQPRLLEMKASTGVIFKQRVSDLIGSLQKKIPAIFESEEFQSTRNDIVSQHMGSQKALFKNFENKVSAENFMMVQVQVGPYTRPDLAPVIVGNPMKIEQLEALVDEGKFSAQELERLKVKYKELSVEMEKIFKEARDIDKTIQEDLEKLSREWVEPLLKDLTDSLREGIDSGAVGIYVDELEADIVNHLDRFRPRIVPSSGAGEAPGPPMLVPPDPSQFSDYEVNVLIDNSDTRPPPVVVETMPTFRNLFGTIERVMDRHGIWFSDYRHIRVGSLLKANGGFLILNAQDVLMEPGVWQGLKRSLRNGVVDIQADPYGFFFSSALKPEKIPISLRVIMIGDPEIYDLLHWYDEDFRKIFKIKADFDSRMPNTDENQQKLVGFIARISSEESLLPCDESGVRVITRLAIRWGGRKNKITAQFERVADLLRESDFRARAEGANFIASQHVDQANRDRIERVNMIEDKIQEFIEEGIIMIETQGQRVGQINGLSVYSFPEFSFGRPSRITVKTSMGKSGIISIEKEADLSGHVYDKGVLILSGFLRDRFAQDKPLNLTASITFEQSYSGVDGDSASSTELYALMSSLSGVPIDQAIAVTGSVNQHGEVQPIGGVNYKIEGFFKVCTAAGLTGSQGVMIPRKNVGDLMLDLDVIEAVKGGMFHIWAVDHVDQGIELLTGISAGQPDENGDYPEGTINYLVNLRLDELSRGMKEYESSDGHDEEEVKKEDAETEPDPVPGEQN
ncbi:MAG: hypothetical protein QG577_275 [Thermodesulfobacteriota bacterium]|nr:hypothetical protein [Thermodesulfobacteriota bacterium]